MEDYGRRTWELPCVCGHLSSEHKARWKNRECVDTMDICLKCLYCMEFKLDNLAYVEQVAKAKGLV